VIERAVIGPYASIEAGAIIKDSIVRNSLIDAQAEIDNAILDGALVGERATIKGRGMDLFVGDDVRIEL
jgi:glucose-1-phosphate thymidylyltransferase